jgi:serine/threonine-protein kinase
MDDSKVMCPMCGEQFSSDMRFCPNDGTTLTRGTTPAHSEPDLAGKIIADRYKVVRELGRGAMGTVYLAEHVKLGRRVALKVMNPSLMSDRDAIPRFNREAGVAAQVSHPNVGTTYDFGETADGLVYIAMEYVEGRTLQQLVDDAHGLPIERASNLLSQIAEGLAAAHRMSIVHRDLTPHNILVARDHTSRDVAKIVDFGIAK